MISCTKMKQILLIVLFSGIAYAMNDAEAKQEFIKVLMECNQKYLVDMSDLLELQEFKSPTKKEVKCLLACAYRKLGTLNDKGMYDLDAGYKIAEQTKDGSDKRLENGKKLADICQKTNEVEVSDGEKGCDRATLLFKCLVENAPKLGFKI